MEEKSVLDLVTYTLELEMCLETTQQLIADFFAEECPGTRRGLLEMYKHIGRIFERRPYEAIQEAMSFGKGQPIKPPCSGG